MILKILSKNKTNKELQVKLNFDAKFYIILKIYKYLSIRPSSV